MGTLTVEACDYKSWVTKRASESISCILKTCLQVQVTMKGFQQMNIPMMIVVSLEITTKIYKTTRICTNIWKTLAQQESQSLYSVTSQSY